MEWVIEKLFYTSAFVAFAATWAIAGWLRDRGVSWRLVKRLIVLASINGVLGLLITGTSNSELESLAYEFLLPIFVAIAIGIMALAGYICAGMAERGRLIAVGVLWFIATVSFLSFAVSEFFIHF